MNTMDTKGQLPAKRGLDQNVQHHFVKKTEI